jgi:hypothetical protein
MLLTADAATQATAAAEAKVVRRRLPERRAGSRRTPDPDPIDPSALRDVLSHEPTFDPGSPAGE